MATFQGTTASSGVEIRVCYKGIRWNGFRGAFYTHNFEKSHYGFIPEGTRV